MAFDTIFSYGVNVERESAVEFVVASTYPCVAAYFLSNETVTPPRGHFSHKIGLTEDLNFPLGWNLNFKFPLGIW